MKNPAAHEHCLFARHLRSGSVLLAFVFEGLSVCDSLGCDVLRFRDVTLCYRVDCSMSFLRLGERLAVSTGG